MTPDQNNQINTIGDMLDALSAAGLPRPEILPNAEEDTFRHFLWNVSFVLALRGFELSYHVDGPCTVKHDGVKIYEARTMWDLLMQAVVDGVYTRFKEKQ